MLTLPKLTKGGVPWMRALMKQTAGDKLCWGDIHAALTKAADETVAERIEAAVGRKIKIPLRKTAAIQMFREALEEELKTRYPCTLTDELMSLQMKNDEDYYSYKQRAKTLYHDATDNREAPPTDNREAPPTDNREAPPTGVRRVTRVKSFKHQNDKTIPARPCGGEQLWPRPLHHALLPPAQHTSLEQLEEDEEAKDSFDVDISVTSPEKVGDGMNAFVAYRVSTRVSLWN
uniref:Uncharacterized protein n=1 Tax=Knipowitschia caucasica TaxID=637954 RepID=A0AAV2L9P7_KNICA